MTLRYQNTEPGSLGWMALDPAPTNTPLPPPPSLLRSHPPRELYVRGRPEAFELFRQLPDFGLAVVGTRRPQARSLQLARARLEMLEGSRLIILSGLARGVDAEAHEAALRARLPTIAVLGSSLEDIYPAENRELADRIVEHGGLLVTEFGPGAKIEPRHFLLRNRLIAVWSKAVWVVEAGHRSGALNTASWAWNHDRDIYITPSFPGDAAYAGNHALAAKDKAYAFWEPSNLAHSWPALETLGHPRRIHPVPALWKPPLGTPGGSRRQSKNRVYNDGDPQYDALSLKKEVQRATVRQGGATVDFLLDWAIGHQWDPQRFFEALRFCLEQNQVQDRGGILCALFRIGRQP